MIGLLQRVSKASVRVGGTTIASIDAGLLVLVAVEQGDGDTQARRLADRLLAYRVFQDATGRMNLDVRQAGGSLLLVPQFTLAADTRKGNRPSLSGAADPAAGKTLFELLVHHASDRGATIATGRFGAEMEISLVNQGPVTIWLRVPPSAAKRC